MVDSVPRLSEPLCFPDLVSDLRKYKVDKKIFSYSKIRPRVCTDGSVSYPQPSSAGVSGWEGKCGQTAAANTATMLCKKHIAPQEVDKLSADLTPGLRPDTVRRILNKIWKKHRSCTGSKWYLNIQSRAKAFHHNLNGLLKKNIPVPVLIQTPDAKLSLHWVTVVGVSGFNTKACQYSVNSGKGQVKVACSEFGGWAAKVGKYYPILRSFTSLSLKEQSVLLE